MPSPRTRLIQTPNPLVPGTRSKYRYQNGWNGDGNSAYPYSTVFEVVKGNLWNPFSQSWISQDAGNAPGNFVVPASKQQSCYNRAYDRFISRAKGVTAQLGATVGELGQSSYMIKNRCQALYSFTRNLSKRYTRKASRDKKFRNRYRQFSDYWLEYSFGWAPLFGDLYNASKVMESPIKSQKCYGGAHVVFEGETNQGFAVLSQIFEYSVLLFADVKVTNPNLALANRLGLVNPAAIAWELTRFSFVVDWMTDMGSWINSWTDRFGFEYENAGESHKQIGSQTQTGTTISGYSRADSVVAQRVLGISLPQPNFDVLANVGRNLRRAANALALTIQLTSKRR